MTAFAPLEQNMSSSYKLFMDNCFVENFNYLLKATHGSFADSIGIDNSIIQNLNNGIVLAADEKGDYNAEMVSISNSQWTNVANNVIHFYRGGYDESTIGGYLTLSNNTFTRCGQNEKSGLLIKTPGIINVMISANTFTDNPVSLVARMWGIKNNHHRDNTLVHSGRIIVEEHQKLELLY